MSAALAALASGPSPPPDRPSLSSPITRPSPSPSRIPLLHPEVAGPQLFSDCLRAATEAVTSAGMTLDVVAGDLNGARWSKGSDEDTVAWHDLSLSALEAHNIVPVADYS